MMSSRSKTLIPIGLLALFQLLFTSFVALVNMEALTAAYISLTGLGIFFFGALLSYVEKSNGNSIITFIFAVMVLFGLAVQATLNKPGIMTIIIYLLMFFACFAICVIHNRITVFAFAKHEKACKCLALTVTLVIAFLIIIGGSGQDGTRSWFNVFGVSVQLTELLKIPFIYLLSTMVEKDYMNESYVVNNKNLVKSTLLMMFFGFILILSNELGTLLVLLLVWLAFLFFFAENRKLFYAIVLAATVLVAIGLIVVYSIINSETEISNHIVAKLITRIGSFVSIKDVTQDQAYQILKSQEAIVIGGLFGSSTNFSRIVNAENDMVFPYIISKLGIFVGLIIFAVFVALFIKAQKSINAFCKNTENGILCTNINVLLLMQSVVNIFASVNLLPLTGIPLCLGISDGGTWMILSSSLFAYVITSTCKEKIPWRKKKTSEIIDEFYFEDGVDNECN